MAENKEEPRGGKVVKVIAYGPSGDRMASTSRQLSEDLFASVDGYGTRIIEPPYSMEQFVLLAEQHPVHSSAIDQKASDLIGKGPQFISTDPKVENVGQLEEVQEWWHSLFDLTDSTGMELLLAVAEDYEKLAWGMIEVVRDAKENAAALYYVPAHTIRALSNQSLYVQRRNGKSQYFKKWGLPENFYVNSGRSITDGRDVHMDSKASEFLVFKRSSSRSVYYGIPRYVSAVGHITLALAARDFNILFFENRREPRHIITITGLSEEVEATITEIEEQLVTQGSDPHKNLFLPISGDAKVQIFSIGSGQRDMDFQRLVDAADTEILIAHRLPPDRIGLVKRGALSGNVSNSVNKIYKEGVVSKSQALFESRLSKFLQVEFARYKGIDPKEVLVKFNFEEVDISDTGSLTVNDLLNIVKADVFTLNEARTALGKGTRDEFKDMTLTEFLNSVGAITQFHQAVKNAFTPVQGHSTDSFNFLADRLDSLDDTIREWITSSDESSSGLMSPVSEMA